MALSDWSSTASANATTLGVNIAEGCPPSNINDAIRKAMADVAGGINVSVLGTFLASTTLAQARTALGVPEGSTSVTAFNSLTNTANMLPYMTGTDGWALTALTSFARTLLDDGDAATMRATIGAIGITISGSASSGSAAITSGATTVFKIQWKDVTTSGRGTTAVTYPGAFSSWSRAWFAGGDADTSSTFNNPFATSPSINGCSLLSANAAAITGTVFAIGV